MSIYEQAIQEHFNIYNPATLEVVTAMNEAEQKSAITSLCDRLYQKLIGDKFDKIDFGDIEKSKGDITSYSGYKSTLDSLDIISGLIKEFKGDITSVNTIYKAIQNIEENKNGFMKGFMLNVEMPMVLYNSLTLAVVSATSLLIATCVEFIKSPNADNFDLELDKISLNKSKDHLLFRNLDKFNNSCTKGDFQKAISFVLSGYVKEKGLIGTTTLAIGAVTGAAIVIVLMNIIPILREILFFYYNIRTKISDYFELQSELLQANAYRVEANPIIDPERRKEIAKKQHDIAEKFAKFADSVAVKMKTADNKATSDAKRESSKKFEADEIIDTIPDKMVSISNSLF